MAASGYIRHAAASAVSGATQIMNWGERTFPSTANAATAANEASTSSRGPGGRGASVIGAREQRHRAGQQRR